MEILPPDLLLGTTFYNYLQGTSSRIHLPLEPIQEIPYKGPSRGPHRTQLTVDPHMDYPTGHPCTANTLKGSFQHTTSRDPLNGNTSRGSLQVLYLQGTPSGELASADTLQGNPNNGPLQCTPSMVPLHGTPSTRTVPHCPLQVITIRGTPASNPHSGDPLHETPVLGTASMEPLQRTPSRRPHMGTTIRGPFQRNSSRGPH